MSNIGHTPSEVGFGQVRILNLTGRTIAYRFQWGNSTWQDFSLAGRPGGGTAEVHSFAYGEQGEPPPTPRIQFESIWTAGTPTSSMETLDLEYNDVGMGGGVPRTYSFAFSASPPGPNLSKLDLNPGSGGVDVDRPAQ